MAADHYAGIDDVNCYVPQVAFTASSKPNETTVAAFIEDVANDMDMVLSNIGYVTPVVSGPKALQWLRKTCALGALGIAQASRDTGVTTAVNASGRESKNIWQQMYEARMKAIADPQDQTELPDAPRTNEQLQKQPENVLRSMSQGITDDLGYDPNAPAVTRYQTL
jgi:hypothetical protein